MIRVAEALTINQVGNHIIGGSEVREIGESGRRRKELPEPLGGVWKGEEELCLYLEMLLELKSFKHWCFSRAGVKMHCGVCSAGLCCCAEE